MNVNNIKSADLCERCVYSYDTHCSGKNCLDCERRLPGGNCKCLSVKKNTPCPDFKEKGEK